MLGDSISEVEGRFPSIFSMPKRKRSEVKKSTEEKSITSEPVKAADFLQRWHWYSKAGVVANLLQLDPNATIERIDGESSVINVAYADGRTASFVFGKIIKGSTHICTPSNVSVKLVVRSCSHLTIKEIDDQLE